MKTMNFFAMAIAGLAFIACNNENEVNMPQVETGEKANFVINMGSITRAAIEDPIDGTDASKAKFDKIQLFVVDNDNKIIGSKYVILAAASATSQMIEGVKATAAKVYIVGNSDEITIATDGTKTLSELKATVAPTYTHTSQNETGKYNVVLLDGIGTIDKSATVSPVADYDFANEENEALNTYAVSIELVPAVSRFQIHAVTGNGKVDNFEIAGIYLNKAYTGMKLDLTGSGALSDESTDASTYTAARFGAYALIGDDLDINGAADDKCAAINFFAGATTLMQPHILVHLKNITYNSAYVGLSEGWLTIKSFNNNSSLFANFKRGDIYNIADIIFGEANIGPNPYSDKINLNAAITVKAWNQVDLIPNF